MKLQAKLTLGFVLLATVMVGLISAMDLVINMEQQFDATLERAEMLEKWAGKDVTGTLNSQRAKPLGEALRDQALTDNLVDLMANARAILYIAVVDPVTKDVLADSQPRSVGEPSETYPDFRALVRKTGWYAKFKALFGNDNYQLEELLGPPVIALRVVVAPAFIRNDITPALLENAKVAIVSVVGAFAITFLFSTLAFRPLGRLARQLDLVARGEYESDKLTAAKPASDEVSVMASKVSLLGQRLRGAQFEVSDLRGNIDRLLQDLEDAVFVFNREGCLVFASGSVEKFLGKRRSDLPGEPIAAVFPPSTTLGLLVAQAAQTGRPIRNRRVPLESPDGAVSTPAVVLFSVDILEALPGRAQSSGVLVRLRDPEAQRQLGRELQTADRLAAISRVTGGVAHEVKNPLNAILLHVEVAKAKLARGDTEVAPQMEIIGREILRLDRVVKTFLDFTRPVELKLVNTPVCDLVRELVELARPQADAAGIRIHVDQDSAEGVEVRVDRDLLKQAMLNLVVNAIEAMPQGGDLRFETLASGHTAEIRISDTGPGIPPELREKIFRLYFTTRKEGSGIGLAMTFRIVQLHDGAIDFSSEPGQGATFFIRLPIVV
ncbi:MAG: two-component system sensor histidine kinase NtrB [Bryobacteraceae bacterium]